MQPLIAAAQMVSKQKLDTSFESSDISEICVILQSMDDMRLSLKNSLESQWEAEQRMREQIASLAHDIKSPLTVLRGNAELLVDDAREGKITGEQAEYAVSISEASVKIDTFIERIVELSYASEASSASLDGKPMCTPSENKVFLDVQPLDLLPFMAELELQVKHVVAVRSLNLNVTRDTTLDTFCSQARPAWNSLLVERAVLNLIGNACDYAQSQIALILEYKESENALVISVEDDGPGFSDEALKRSTERFYRGDPARSTAPGELHFGLGLTVVLECARVHNGKFEASNRFSKQGILQGARVSLTLPIRPIAKALQGESFQVLKSNS